MTKISELTAVTTAAATDTLAVVQGGVTKKVTVQEYLTDGVLEVAGAAATVQGNLTTHANLVGASVHGLGTASTFASTAFDAAGAAALRVAKTGDTMTGALSFSGTTHAGLKLNSLTTTQRDALTPAAGMAVFNTDDDEAQYYDGTYWRQFSGTPSLPVTLDFTAMSDGALPAFVYADTWSISTGKAINTPRLGAELLTDPGLEAAYVAGLCGTLTMNGSPTVAESADAHGGSKAQQFTATAFNNRLNYPVFAGVAGAWYKFSIWAKRTAGTAGNNSFIIEQTLNIPAAGASQRLTGAAYQQEAGSLISTTTNNMFIFAVREVTGGGSYDTVIIDDGSFKRITYSDLFAMLDGGDRTATVKAQPSTLADGTLSGAVAWASGVSSPDTYLLAYWRYRAPKDLINVGLIKCVSGTYTSLIAETSAVITPGAWVEIRPVDSTTVGLYYDNVQISTDQTVTDVPGKRAGFLASGGNNLDRFFVG